MVLVCLEGRTKGETAKGLDCVGRHFALQSVLYSALRSVNLLSVTRCLRNIRGGGKGMEKMENNKPSAVCSLFDW